MKNTQIIHTESHRKTVLCIEEANSYIPEGIEVKDLIIEEVIEDGIKYVTVKFTKS